MFQFLQPLSFGQRLLLYRLVIALGVAGMVYWAFFIPKSGERAMRRAGADLRKAKSWKVQWTNTPIGGDFKLEYMVEVSCPSRLRMTEHTVPDAGSRRVEGTSVTMAIDGAVYLYNSRENGWRRGYSNQMPYAGDCAALARGEDTSLLPPFGKYEHKGFMKKGEIREITGEQCREWSVVIFRGRNSPTDNYTVCLGVNDDLPRSHSAGSMEFRYFDWDVPIVFTVPPLREP
jgi:hypothetical protein